MGESNYDPKITLKKFVTGWIYAIIPITLSYSLEFIETETFPPEYAVLIAVISAGLHAFVNWWKHKDN